MLGEAAGSGRQQAATTATCAPAHRPASPHQWHQWLMLRCCSRAAAGEAPPWRACTTARQLVSPRCLASICSSTPQTTFGHSSLACLAAAALRPCAVPTPATCRFPAPCRLPTTVLQPVIDLKAWDHVPVLMVASCCGSMPPRHAATACSTSPPSCLAALFTGAENSKKGEHTQ